MSDVGSVSDWTSIADQYEAHHDNNIVRFFNKEVLDKRQSEIDGRPRYRLVPFVEMFAPGQKKTQCLERKATEEDKKRYPVQWSKFNHNNEEVIGTPIEKWPYLNRAMVAEMKAIGFYTVESIAAATDSGLAKIGHGALDLQKRAQQFLKPQGDVETELRSQVKALQDRVRELEVSNDHLKQVAEAKKRGRPKKVNDDSENDLPERA